jgi:hypothetical protein
MPDMANQALTTLPWAEISRLTNSEHFKTAFSAISTETLEYVLNDDNYQELVEAALEGIKTTEPEKANLEYAVLIADTMKKFAAQVLRERTSN